MGCPMLLNYPPGTTFSNINSITLSAGVAWGECNLRVIPLEGYSGELLEQYMSIPRAVRGEYQVPDTVEITKRLFGVSIGLGLSGPIDDAADSVEDLITLAVRQAERRIRRSTVRGLRESGTATRQLARGLSVAYDNALPFILNAIQNATGNFLLPE